MEKKSSFKYIPVSSRTSMGLSILTQTLLIAVATCIVLSFQGLIIPAYSQQLVQSSPPGDVQQQSSNLTAAISIVPTLVDAVKSKIKVGLNDAITGAVETVGENSTAVSASLEPEGEFLLYRVIVLDENNNVHMVLIDPANGARLLKEELPAQIMGSLMGGIPMARPEVGEPSDFVGP